jgi:hypothetical protein
MKNPPSFFWLHATPLWPFERRSVSPWSGLTRVCVRVQTNTPKKKGCEESVKLLLEHGGDPNAKHSLHSAPVYCAAQSGVCLCVCVHMLRTAAPVALCPCERSP